MLYTGWCCDTQGHVLDDPGLRLAALPLAKLCPVGFVFIWAEKEHISTVNRQVCLQLTSLQTPSRATMKCSEACMFHLAASQLHSIQAVVYSGHTGALASVLAVSTFPKHWTACHMEHMSA